MLFIPLFLVSERSELQCLACGYLTRVSRDEADQLKAGLPSA
ncbi:MAG TPA: hypothetical protein VES01_08510 [Dermatophilaceae bacterium]|nr:hypothetical protein [Dermatophilaceae bacterium]